MSAMARQRLGKGGKQGLSGSETGPVKGVVFDLDGVLYRAADFETGSLRALSALAASRLGYDFGRTLMAFLALHAAHRGVTPLLFREFAAREGKKPSDAAWLWDAYLIQIPEMQTINGVIPMLETLRFGRKVGVMAGGDPDQAVRKLKGLRLWGRLDAIHPRTAHGAAWTRLAALKWFAASFGAAGPDLVFVGAGDSAGLDAARSLGWQTVWVRGQEAGEGLAPVPRAAQWVAQGVLDVERVLKGLGAARESAGDGKRVALGAAGGVSWAGSAVFGAP